MPQNETLWYGLRSQLCHLLRLACLHLLQRATHHDGLHGTGLAGHDTCIRAHAMFSREQAHQQLRKRHVQTAHAPCCPSQRVHSQRLRLLHNLRCLTVQRYVTWLPISHGLPGSFLMTPTETPGVTPSKPQDEKVWTEHQLLYVDRTDNPKPG